MPLGGGIKEYTYFYINVNSRPLFMHMNTPIRVLLSAEESSTIVVYAKVGRREIDLEFIPASCEN